MPTFSAFARNAFRTGLLEAQDVLVDCDEVELIHLKPSKGFRLREEWLTRLIYHDPSRRLASFNPGLQPYRLRKDYDLFMLVCPHWRDILYANAIQGWQERCRTSVCWIDELWAKDMVSLQHWLRLLNGFDHVIVGISGSGKPLADLLERPCHELPAGVDAVRFSPYPIPPARAVGVLSIGRRLDEIHRALLSLADRKNIFYIYDTVQTGDSQVPDHREHRTMYANMAKRSLFFMASPGKVNSPAETGGQVDLGFRYFEGSVAGAVLIGQKPDCKAFYENFDWPQAVIEISPDGSDTVEVISDLLAEAEIIKQISSRNAKEGLLRHDWVYRWKEIFRIAGLKPGPTMEAREKRLNQLAEMVGQEYR